MSPGVFVNILSKQVSEEVYYLTEEIGYLFEWVFGFVFGLRVRVTWYTWAGYRVVR